MVKRQKQSNNDIDITSRRLLVAFFGGACAFIAVESTCDDVRIGPQHMESLPSWQVHMGSAFLGITTFVIALFFLEVFETRSKATAWQSSSPWMPLIALTALATGVHIAYYVVIPIGAIYGIWAYRKTRGVHRVYVASVNK
jgi:hypothetical protein